MKAMKDMKKSVGKTQKRMYGKKMALEDRVIKTLTICKVISLSMIVWLLEKE